VATERSLYLDVAQPVPLWQPVEDLDGCVKFKVQSSTYGYTRSCLRVARPADFVHDVKMTSDPTLAGHLPTDTSIQLNLPLPFGTTQKTKGGRIEIRVQVRKADVVESVEHVRPELKRDLLR
jgi:hypothetical protein